MNILLEDVRSLQGRHEIPLRPLTIVVGENSSGKSTILGAVAALSNSERFPGQAGFNTPPFSFGGFSEIASMRRGGQARSFGIGYILDTNAHPEGGFLSVLARYRDDSGRPVIASLDVETRSTSLHLKHFMSSGNVKLSVSYEVRPSDAEVARRTFHHRGSPPLPLSELTIDSLFAFVVGMVRQKEAEKSLHRGERQRDVGAQSPLALFEAARPLLTVGRDGAAAWGTVKSLAPVRTKPQRTYDVTDDLYTPEGEHIPYRLRGEARRSKVLASLDDFGVASGLFDFIRIKRLGSQSSSPFQVLVGLAGEPVNLANVGYGVSQSLPVITETLLTKERSTLLVQQPEVHLHPRAQAALGTFFTRAAASGVSRIIIETHSDYLLDRVRQEVAAGTIAPHDVAILFTERSGLNATVHQIELDKTGNVLGAPPSYRAFFVDEELRLLSRGS